MIRCNLRFLPSVRSFHLPRSAILPQKTSEILPHKSPHERMECGHRPRLHLASIFDCQSTLPIAEFVLPKLMWSQLSCDVHVSRRVALQGPYASSLSVANPWLIEARFHGLVIIRSLNHQPQGLTGIACLV